MINIMISYISNHQWIKFFVVQLLSYILFNIAMSNGRSYAPWKKSTIVKPIQSSNIIDTSSLQTTSTVVPSNIEVDRNFQDPFVECTSEGNYIPMEKIIQERRDMKRLLEEQLQDAKTLKNLNFNDENVDCTSEGGEWNMKSNSMDIQSQINIQEVYSDDSSIEMKKTAKAISTNVIGFAKYFVSKLEFAIEMSKIESTAVGVVRLCDMLDQKAIYDTIDKQIIRARRYLILSSMLSQNRENYISTVTFLNNRIARADLPNVQDIPYPNIVRVSSNKEFVPDCTLPNITYKDSILDNALLGIFRNLVRKEINFVSSTPGIRGLLEEGRHFMLSEEGTPENQHKFVRNSLAGLLTPFLPPFYRLFMAGMIPSKEKGDPEWLVSSSDTLIQALPEAMNIKPGKQFGPLFYAPFLTSIVTPPFLNFLVGPSHVNLRKDGKLGGMVVEKCKFLQESGCKGLCLHQCKLPAQQFFTDTLGVPLTVSPNFETQECQWSWGEEPMEYSEDPSFPKGCLAGCETRNFKKGNSIIESSKVYL